MDLEPVRILIVGCGELGSRHLQAVASLSSIAEVVVVDPKPEGLQLGQRRLEDLPDRSRRMTFRWFPDLEKVQGPFDLCIVATQAKGRCPLVRQAAETTGCQSFLLEKIVAQSIREYEDLLQFSREKNLNVWVNCKTRAYPIVKRIKKKLDPKEPILFNVLGGNHGLANNGIHEADLFVFLDACESIESRGIYIDPVLYPSKRGPQVFDLSGTMLGVTSKGSQFILSYAGSHASPDHLSIVAKNYRCVIDHMYRWGYESEKGGPWQPLSFEGNLMVSAMTKTFANDILAKRRCDLPTLAECYAAHRFILGALQPHFHKLSGARDYCPVT